MNGTRGVTPWGTAPELSFDWKERLAVTGSAVKRIGAGWRRLSRDDQEHVLEAIQVLVEASGKLQPDTPEVES